MQHKKNYKELRNGTNLIYLWYDTNEADRCKLGETFMKDNSDPSFEQTQAAAWSRIREDLGTRKYLIAQGRIKLIGVWDVTHWAIDLGKHIRGSHAYMDDHIRSKIGHRLEGSREYHAASADYIKIKIEKLLISQHQPLPEVKLSSAQSEVLHEIVTNVNAGKRTFLAELCPRFGKTILTGALISELNTQLNIIVSYIQTSFASFERDLTGHDQFREYIHVDTSFADYQEKIEAALNDGKKVVAYLSMCNSTLRQGRIDYLFSRETTKLAFVDEADYGVHRSGQADPLIDSRQPHDIVVLGTGTNGDRAVGTWDIDHIVSYTYPELLMTKRLTIAGKVKKKKLHKNFKIDLNRNLRYVDLEFYQLSLQSIIDQTKILDEPFSSDLLPSWTKFASDPAKAKGFFTNMMTSLFLGQNGNDETNLDLQTDDYRYVGKPKVSMIFMPGNMRNEMLIQSANYAQECLPNYIVKSICGLENITNRTAELEVRELIEKCEMSSKNLIIMATGMATRSFSIAEIDRLFLAYDGGELASTIQKLSRVLTPGSMDKIGKVFSLSFDPNRLDAFAPVVYETLKNYRKKNSVKPIKESIQDILNTIDIYRCTKSGRVKMTVTDYLEVAMQRDTISRAIGKSIDMSRLTKSEIRQLANSFIGYRTMGKEETTAKGKAKKASDIQMIKALPDFSQKELNKAREAIIGIIESVDVLIDGTNSKTLKKTLSEISNNPDYMATVQEEFGVDFDVILSIFNKNVVTYDEVELLHVR